MSTSMGACAASRSRVGAARTRLVGAPRSLYPRHAKSRTAFRKEALLLTRLIKYESAGGARRRGDAAAERLRRRGGHGGAATRRRRGGAARSPRGAAARARPLSSAPHPAVAGLTKVPLKKWPFRADFERAAADIISRGEAEAEPWMKDKYKVASAQAHHTQSTLAKRRPAI